MKTVLLAGAAVLAMTAAAQARSPVMGIKATPHKVISALPGAVTLYDQTDSVVDTAISSDNFTSGSLAGYDDQGADDFVVPAGHRWKIRQVNVLGHEESLQPASSLNVIFYADAGGVPGSVVAECDNQSNAGFDVASGYAIRLNRPKGSCRVPRLAAGTYWVSVVANETGADFQNDWFWRLNATIRGTGGEWQNPGGGFNNCTSWCDDSNADGGFSADYAFTLIGRDRVL